MSQTVEIRFKGNRRGFYAWADVEAPLRPEEPVLVECERGVDLGRVNTVGDVAAAKCGGCDGCGTGEDPSPTATPRVVRRAAPEEIATHEALRLEEEVVRQDVGARASAQGLAMRISDTEWQWDRNRLTVYFTSERRVDFRALVRELASRYRTRIELRQIGVRDEAARLGGIGRCGREFCCSTWLNEPGPVSLSLAKDQNLSLNPSQISGGCGRLLCCLKYEHEYYLTARKRFPKEGKQVVTLRGPEKVLTVDILGERVTLRSPEHGVRTLPLVALRDEVAKATAALEAAAPTHDGDGPDGPRRPPRSRRKPRGGSSS
jgi:cell fate regulator YaaT (PSP1 superfamily)